MKLNYGVMILAAGASTRMGTSKQLLKIGDQTLLQKTISTALAIEPFNCTVVLGANYELHKKNIEHLPVDIIRNANWENGMGSSIKAGVLNLKKYKIDAFYTLVCDQPLLTSTHLKNLAAKYEKANGSVVASGYDATIGVPAIFDWHLHKKILQIPDKEGAKGFILAYSSQVVEFEGGGVDLDTKENLENFLGFTGNK